MLIKDFFTSSWSFNEQERELRSKFQMMNIAIVLSSTAVVYGTVLNLYKEFFSLAIFEFLLFLANIVLWYMLRRSKKFYDFVSIAVTAQFTFLLILLIYISSPEEMKHTWYFTYPIIILYFKNEKYAIPWFVFLISMLLIAPFQPFFETQYSFFQLFYISFVLSIVSIIVYFYKVKMDEATQIISTQEKILSKKVVELTQKDKMLTVQSKQAVMGEMISMIAHQWRQPLSTVTLSISNLQVKKLLGEEIEEEEFDQALENISNTVVYLSQTIDDFQTYFRPDKEFSSVDINELIEKAIGFVEPRLKKTAIEIKFFPQQRLVVNTYANEIIQVLLNIINNAVDELISRNIKYPKVVINVFNRDKEVVISIADNAGGIAPEYIDSIFEPYFSTKGKNGTGLGLYMSQMIMQKQFQTAIEVKSTNYGSIFTIVVPKKLA
ncbi:sensor histidine kinase [Sulfurimonas indica]|nr:HAMP domain-containing sensor histidine kinase [Sulfurimonas indica]